MDTNNPKTTYHLRVIHGPRTDRGASRLTWLLSVVVIIGATTAMTARWALAAVGASQTVTDAAIFALVMFSIIMYLVVAGADGPDRPTR